MAVPAAKPIKRQMLDLLKTRLESIEQGSSYFRTVDEVAFLDRLPEEEWIAHEHMNAYWKYVITIAEVTEARDVESTGRVGAILTLAISGFFRRKPRENPWGRADDADIQLRDELASDIHVAMVTPDNQLGMLSKTPFPRDVDPIEFSELTTHDHWVGVRTTWDVLYRFRKAEPWVA